MVTLTLFSISEETLGIFQFYKEIMVFDVWTKFDFLNLEYLLFLLCFLITFLLFISVLAIIHDTAYRWAAVGRHLDEIKSLFFRNADCFMERHDPQLFVCITDYTDFSGPNLFIDTQFFTYSFHLRKRNHCK